MTNYSVKRRISESTKNESIKHLQDLLEQIERATLSLNSLYESGDDEINREAAVKAKSDLCDAVESFQQKSGLSSARLGAELGISDQTVLRWKKTEYDDPYFKTRPSELVLTRWRELADLLSASHALNLRDELGLWKWEDLVALDNDPKTRRVWIVSSDNFGEAAHSQEFRKLIKRVTDPERSVTYIYVFPHNSDGERSFDIMQEYGREILSTIHPKAPSEIDTDDTPERKITGSVLGIGLPVDKYSCSISALYNDTQAVFYDHADENRAFLALPYDENLPHLTALDLGYLWKKMPSKIAASWNGSLFVPLWRQVTPHLNKPIATSTKVADSINLEGGGTLHVAIYPYQEHSMST